MPKVRSMAQLGLMLSKGSPLAPKQKSDFKEEIKGKSFEGLPEHVADKKESEKPEVVKKYPPRSQKKVGERLAAIKGGQ